MKALLVLLAILFVTSNACAQSELTGTVRERVASGSGDGIPGASIAILGTSRGAKANSQGKYRLMISGTSVRLRISAIGYRPDTVTLTAPFPTTRDFALTIAPITGQDVVVTPNDTREEARRIMRKVIETKETWQPLINNYAFDVYGRLNARTISSGDTSIISIIESIAKGYWERGKGYAEHIVARKQTANLPASANRFTMLGIMNFYDERVELPDYTIVSPLARDAFDRYDYDLLGVMEINGSQSYKISVEPRGALAPALEGTLYIDQIDHTVTYLSLAPNKAVKIGPLKDGRVEQTFRFIDNKYWMPAENKFFIKAEFTMPLIPSFTVEHVAVLQNYVINAGVPDSVFANGGRKVAPNADSITPVAWAEMRVIPLNDDEQKAYTRIDSVTTIQQEPRSFSPIGFAIGLLLGGTPYSFNRVEGSRFEIGTGFSDLAGWPLSLQALGAYGVSDERFKYDVSMSQALLWNEVRQVQGGIGSDGEFHSSVVETNNPLLSLGVRLYDDVARIGDAYGKLINTATALFFGSDYPNYYRTHGGYLELEWTPTLRTSLTLRGLNERQLSLATTNNFTIFDKANIYRLNPPVAQGLYRAIELNGEHSFEWLDQNITLGFDARTTDPSLGSDFEFSRLSGTLEYSTKLGGLGKFSVNAFAGSVLSGTPGYQHVLGFETYNAIISKADVFRTMEPHEFKGDHLWSVMLEQNFYDLPMRLLGISFLDPLDLHWLAFGNAGQALLSQQLRPQLGTLITGTGDTPFVEAGAGIANIFNVARIDAAWRLTHKRETNFRASLSFGIS
ncbi:MAG TPA: DUF5686 family protein, partial [Candidatus Kapabacteria bacterium]|nr:DUF5686 family protein [Candidatus Kapabacteria bacterium]